MAKDTGGVPKMVGKMSNGRDPEIPEAATRCGGAIMALSDSDNKYEEMLLKRRIVRRTISDWVARTTAECIQHVDMLMIDL